MYKKNQVIFNNWKEKRKQNELENFNGYPLEKELAKVSIDIDFECIMLSDNYSNTIIFNILDDLTEEKYYEVFDCLNCFSNEHYISTIRNNQKVLHWNKKNKEENIISYQVEEMDNNQKKSSIKKVQELLNEIFLYEDFDEFEVGFNRQLLHQELCKYLKFLKYKEYQIPFHKAQSFYMKILENILNQDRNKKKEYCNLSSLKNTFTQNFIEEININF